MNGKFKFLLGAVCAFLCGLCLSNGAFGQTLPDGKGKAEFLRICTACHTTDTVTSLRKTPEEWRKTVDEMVARGANGSKEDLDNVVLYLSTNFGPDKPGSSAAPPSTTHASTPGGRAALNSAEIERVKRFIADDGCLASSCGKTRGIYRADIE